MYITDAFKSFFFNDSHAIRLQKNAYLNKLFHEKIVANIKKYFNPISALP